MSKKYRPYLSLPMMERIISLCEDSFNPKNPMELNPLDDEIISSLKILVLKGKHGITQPSFTPIVDKLGIPELSTKELMEEKRYLSGTMSPEESLSYEIKLMEKINGTHN